MRMAPTRGGFLRPFGCGWFIREFLLGNGPEGSTMIDPNRGSTQTTSISNTKMLWLVLQHVSGQRK